jgi:hypothetical protein
MIADSGRRWGMGRDRDWEAALTRKRTAAATLNEREVARIKRLFKEGWTPRQVAEAYLVGIETARRIRREESWAWVEAEGEAEQRAEAAARAPASPELEARIKASQDKLLQLIKADQQETGLVPGPYGIPVRSQKGQSALADLIALEGTGDAGREERVAGRLREEEAVRTAPDRMLEELVNEKGDGDGQGDSPADAGGKQAG